VSLQETIAHVLLQEGAELEVLKSLDFSAVRINVIAVEQDASSPEKDEAVRTLLLANGFELDRSAESPKEHHSSVISHRISGSKIQQNKPGLS